MSIRFKHQYIGNYKWKYKYSICDGPEEIGTIAFTKENKIFIIGFLNIFSHYQGKHYGYETINYILTHYKVNCMIGKILRESGDF